jgi:palmitoyl-protein thioesterase
VQNDPLLRNGFDLVCHSQGNILCRGYISFFNNPPVRNYVSLSGPNAGYFGAPQFATQFQLAAHEASLLAYTQWGQKHVIPAAYWRDPSKLDAYLATSVLLPYMNNEIEHELFDQVRDNFTGLDNVVLLASPVDGVINPYQSAHFGFFADGQSSKVLPAEKFAWYKGIGLDVMEAENRVHYRTCEVEHVHFIHHDDGFECFQQTWLEFLGTPLPA